MNNYIFRDALQRNEGFYNILYAKRQNTEAQVDIRLSHYRLVEAVRSENPSAAAKDMCAISFRTLTWDTSYTDIY
jgi:hypothetical protein